MLARGALCRLAGRLSPHDLPQLARALDRTLVARHASTNPAVCALACAYSSAREARRTYATTTRATEPTATVKKAVKAKAAKPATPKAKAKTKTIKDASTSTRPKRKTTAEKTVAAKPEKKTTPEEELKAAVTELRKKILKPPVTHTVVTGFLSYMADKITGLAKGSATAQKGGFSTAASEWKSLTPAEHEHYNHIASEKTAAKRAEYLAWIHSHTPEQIKQANKARVLLRKKLQGTSKNRRFPAHSGKLYDDRTVKKPTTPFFHFVTERNASGDFKGILIKDRTQLIANEWKALSAGEKSKYEQLYEAEKTKYAAEIANQ